MAQSKSAGTSANWTSIQAYVLATICLVVGIAVGYLLRGSAAGDTRPQPSAAPAAASAGMPATNSQPTPEQLKHMADTQAQPILAQLTGSPNDPKLLAQAGNVYYDAQQYRNRRRLLWPLTASRSQGCERSHRHGHSLFYLGDPDRALQEFQTALKSDPKHGQTMFNMGMVLWQGKGDISGAVAAWEKLLKTVPDYPERARVEEMLAKAKQHANIKPGTKTSKPASM